MQCRAARCLAPSHAKDRRSVLSQLIAATLFGTTVSSRSMARPTCDVVGGIDIVDTPIARAAAALSKQTLPDPMFGHSMRTYLFASLIAERERIAHDREATFIAAILHDIGLASRFSTKAVPFEMDGADAALQFLNRHGVRGERAESVWNAIAMHTSALVAHQPKAVSLVARGAQADVYGSGLSALPQAIIKAILVAYPRRGFTTDLQQTLLANCRRKPLAQSAWTDAYCRRHVEDVVFPDIARDMGHFPYPDR